MAINTGTLVSAAIRPVDTLDTIATAYASEVKGGLHTVSNSTDRNNIIFERREWGMMCYVVSDNKTYQLKYNYVSTDIMNNSNWVEFSGSSGGGSSIEWLDSVKSVLSSQPGSPINGDRYLISNSPSGVIWSGYPDYVTQWNSVTSIWDMTEPKDGMSVRVDNEDESIYKYEGVYPSGVWKKERLNQIFSIEPITSNGVSYSVSSSPTFSQYTKDMILLTKFSSSNIGSTVSININSIGEKLVKKPTSSGLSGFYPNDIEPGVIYNLTYDGTYFQLNKPYVNEDLFNVKYYVESTDYIVVPQYYQYWVYSDLEIAGTLVNYGQVIIANGSLILSGGTFSSMAGSSIALVNFSTGATTSYNDTDTIQFSYDNTIFGPSVSSIVKDGSLTASKLNTGLNGGATAGYFLSVDGDGEFKWSQSTVNAGDGVSLVGDNLTVNVASGLTISSDYVILTDTGATAGYYGNSYSYPVFSVDSQGRITDVATQSLDLSGGSVAIAIGPAEDGTYTDGIFTDFTPSTPVGTAIDRFNEMLLLLSPSSPANWDNAITSISFTDTSYSPRALTSGSGVVNMFTSTTPTLTCVDVVGSQSLARIDTSGLTFSLVDQSVTIETVTLAGTATPLKNTGNIRHSASQDPYLGIAGKAGFWFGIIDFSLESTLPSITPSSNQRTLQLFHPGTDSPEVFNYYIDSPLTVTIGSITASVPSMTSYISGVPTLTTSDTITAIGFSVSNVSSYFYAATSVYQINTGLISGSTGDPDLIPTFYGEVGNVTGKSGTVLTGQFSDLSFTFTVRGRNSIGVYGSNTTFTSNTHRVDTVSVESSRKTSGSGSYPSSGYNGVYDSTQSLIGSYNEELQLRNGLYVYPSVNYTIVGGPDYSTATGTRWATFNLGSFTNNSAFTLNINGSSGITTLGQANLLIQVKIEGATSWVDGDSAYSGVGNPGSGSNGVAAVVVGSSTATSRRITFGSVTYTGSIIVRIGFTGTGLQFNNLSASSIV